MEKGFHFLNRIFFIQFVKIASVNVFLDPLQIVSFWIDSQCILTMVNYPHTSKLWICFILRLCLRTQKTFFRSQTTYLFFVVRKPTRFSNC